ncbi:MAG: DNA repair protein RecN [Alphaproteobacteria bacterium]|nr:DNA repair protein RecN [Alphaproteobacteria bacterium]
MLTRLNINNIVLIERLNLEFGAGLNILTGETGAGKSILLDALALTLGARGDAGLVRRGTDGASVTAEFDNIPPVIRQLLTDVGIDCDDDMLILRRTLSPDGKGRAWINDCAVSIKTLKAVGDALVEIHGQFANHALQDGATHRVALDEFAAAQNKEFADIASATKNAYAEFHAAEKRMAELKDMLARAAMEREFLEHNVAELSALDVHVGEEEDLASQRSAMMNAEKDAAILGDAMAAIAPRGNSLDAAIYSVAHILERIKTSPNPYREQIDKLYEAAQTVSDVAAALNPAEPDTASLEEIEERLFAIRAAARKHRIHADELPSKLAQMAQQLSTIDNSDAELKKLSAQMSQKRAEFDRCATALHNARIQAAEILRTSILAELPELKLGQADFIADITATEPTATGIDSVTFMIKTNPGMPFGALHKTASGGELSRFMLALRVVLAGGAGARTFIFDEIDTGISGATASAVGNRLNRLAAAAQALVITHSAQVAGYADRHFKISKSVANDITTTSVHEITAEERLNEVARIISGAEITPESLTMAQTLIKH